MIANRKIRNILFISILITIGLIIRILYNLPPATFDSDSAVFALMAKHISEFKEFPVYMWGAHYAGTLSSYIGAGLFKIFGISSTTFCAVEVLFSCIWVLFIFILARKILDNYGSLYSLILVLLPPSGVLLYSLTTAGIYPETLVFGSLALLLLIKCSDKSYHNQHIFYPLLGFVAGAGLWLSPAMFPVLLTIITVFIIKDKKVFLSSRFLFLAIGFLIGYLPAIIYNFQYPWASFFRIGGMALDIDRSVLSSPNLTKILTDKILRRISNIPASLIRIPFLFLSLAGVINTCIFFIAISWVFKKDFISFLKNKKMKPINILIIYIIWFLGFHSTLVGGETVRYMIPLYLVFPLLVGRLLSDIRIKSRSISLILLCVILFYNGYSNVHTIMSRKIHHYPELAKWLLSKKFLYGYSDYWTAYPVVFESNERVIISPTLFHPTFCDRRPEYTEKVRNAKNTAFILHQDENSQAIKEIEDRLKKLNASHKRDIFKEFVIYYNFSRKIYPEELNLTWN